jgi:hypothetical protein
MTTASARRTRLPGEREETRAPIQTPGMAPTRMLPVRPRTKSPNSRWPTDAEAQGNGLPEVGTHQLADADRRVEQQQANNHQRAGAHRRRTDDQPATEAQHDGPQRARSAAVLAHLRRRRSGSARAREAGGRTLTPIARAASTRMPPSATRRTAYRSTPWPISRSKRTPANAPGIEPRHNYFTRPRCTVPRRRCTSPPIGFI